MDVHGLRCLVTGTASGIGEAVARDLLERGAQVVSLDRDTPRLDVTQHVGVDLAVPQSIDAALARVEGGVDALINVAGIPGTAPGEMVFQVDFLGLRHLTEAVVDRLNRGGSITNVSSTAGFGWPARLEQITALLATDSFAEGLKWFRAHTPEGNAYNFAKEAVTVYTMSLGASLHRRGLRANAVLPGPVETPILADFEKSMGKENLDGVKAFLGRHGTPQDIAPTVVFLAGRDARWVNGATLVADGGITGAVLAGLVPAPEI
ncbi:3-alpha-hydroxysteroid dehydrogenase [Streptomyces albus]|uniref:3-alpha-hydroxysteroid dehydrogenase n=1 Tax=Streptomyces albus (strain ATCC 21838 / DSM 41398 / FERM P-419 / JCM 4703 / NBRC 107858) TaxID=1081613 RepID=A0A0B5EM50_STRA4|nr:3-alpha-hydroxysteroid dehydrogenase [Streptomyces albus]AOU74740.1 3-alpha-hydroxysteroid dehydrogenase [Streptomyces albus]AYN30551.1 3-alpha-hydroxysteroid dehydrogenase [Streptomyces albus]